MRSSRSRSFVRRPAGPIHSAYGPGAHAVDHHAQRSWASKGSRNAPPSIQAPAPAGDDDLPKIARIEAHTKWWWIFETAGFEHTGPVGVNTQVVGSHLLGVDGGVHEPIAIETRAASIANIVVDKIAEPCELSGQGITRLAGHGAAGQHKSQR